MLSKSFSQAFIMRVSIFSATTSLLPRRPEKGQVIDRPRDPKILPRLLNISAKLRFACTRHGIVNPSCNEAGDLSHSQYGATSTITWPLDFLSLPGIRSEIRPPRAHRPLNEERTMHTEFRQPRHLGRCDGDNIREQRRWTAS